MTRVLPRLAAATRPALVDRFGRRFRYLRASVTDRCNLACSYCTPARACAPPASGQLSWDELDFLVDVAVNDLGAEALRITGGEPLVRPGLARWIRGLRRHEALRDVALTTNGVQLARMASALRDAGLDRVNVSLDTLDPGAFARVTRGGSLARSLEGIDVALGLFRRVKINTVAVRSLVLDALPALVRFSHEKQVEVRFIELMPLLGQQEYFRREFVPVDELKAALASLGVGLVPDGDGPGPSSPTGYGPATTFSVPGTRARLGFISQISSAKCLACNKLRLTSDGALRPCLLMPDEVDLAPAIQARDRATVARAIRHQFLLREQGHDGTMALGGPVGRPMRATGG